MFPISGLAANAVIAAASSGAAATASPGATASVQPPNPYPRTPATPELDCLIEPYMTVELATTVSGIVKVVNVDRGDIIRTGQILAQLDAEVEKANVARERARAEFASKKYHRMRELYKEQMVSAQQMEESKADSDLAAAELKKATELLNQRTVFSPFNGVVVDRYVSPGELVESKKVLKVAQINPLSVEVIAPISMLGEFKQGARMRVVPEGPKSDSYEARVKLVDRVVDAPSGTYRVRLALPNPKHQISAGMRCRAQLILPTQEKTLTTAKGGTPKAAASKNAAVGPRATAKTDSRKKTQARAAAAKGGPRNDSSRGEAAKATATAVNPPKDDKAKADERAAAAPAIETAVADKPGVDASGAAAPPATDIAKDVVKDDKPGVEAPKSEVTKVLEPTGEPAAAGSAVDSAASGDNSKDATTNQAASKEGAPRDEPVVVKRDEDEVSGAEVPAVTKSGATGQSPASQKVVAPEPSTQQTISPQVQTGVADGVTDTADRGRQHADASKTGIDSADAGKAEGVHPEPLKPAPKAVAVPDAPAAIAPIREMPAGGLPRATETSVDL
jgi:RND family efflux transporter MFP subunit